MTLKSRLWVAGMAGALGKYEYGSTRGLSGADGRSNRSPKPNPDPITLLLAVSLTLALTLALTQTAGGSPWSTARGPRSTARALGAPPAVTLPELLLFARGLQIDAQAACNPVQ